MPLTRLLAASAAAAVAVLSAIAPVYRFPAPRPFAGPAIWNPYARLIGTWQPAALHVHGRGGLRIGDGRQPDAEAASLLHQMGYTVVGLANHQRKSDEVPGVTISIYEHGYNAGKRHQLAIGARDVRWFDVPLWQTRSQKQYVIDRVHDRADLVAIAHPTEHRAYTDNDLRDLTGYELLEVVNGPFSAQDLWDAALSAGHPVWGIATDDTHNLTDFRRTATAWTMIDAAAPNQHDVVEALRAGRMYGVKGLRAHSRTALHAVSVQHDTIVVTCAGEPAAFTFVGQDGRVLSTSPRGWTARYTLRPDDSYVRTLVHAADATLYLNPVLRYDGRSPARSGAAINAGATWLLRGAALAVALLSVLVAVSPAGTEAPRDVRSRAARRAIIDRRAWKHQS
jgi:hypothetical protein